MVRSFAIRYPVGPFGAHIPVKKCSVTFGISLWLKTPESSKGKNHIRVWLKNVLKSEKFRRKLRIGDLF